MLSVQIYWHPRGNVIIQDGIDSAQAQIRSRVSNHDFGWGAAEENFLHLVANPDPGSVLEAELVPLPVHPQLPGGGPELQLVLLSVNMELFVPVVDSRKDNNVPVYHNFSVFQVGLEA